MVDFKGIITKMKKKSLKELHSTFELAKERISKL